MDRHIVATKAIAKKKNFVAIYKLQMIICITGDLIIFFSYAK